MCMGALAGWVWARSDLTLSPRLHACTGEFSNRTLTAHTDLTALDVRVAKAWDFPGVTLDTGLALGGELLRERFTTRGIAPARLSPAAHVDAGAGVTVALDRALYLAGELAVQTHFLRIEDAAGERALTARFAVRGVVALGVWR